MTDLRVARPPGGPCWTPGPALALILALCGPASAAASGDEEARALLEQVSEAATKLTYDGVFVYRSGDMMESMRIIHRADPAGSMARLVSLSGEAREVIREANRVTCILPDSGAVLVSNSKPQAVSGLGIFNPRGPYSAHYDLHVAPGERVAGRDTRQVVLEPRDEYRYGYRLSVDRETGFLLKSQLLDREKRVLEEIVYTTLTLPPSIPDELLQPKVSGEGYTWYTTEAPSPGPQESTWRVGWLPEGFEMRDRATDPAGLGRMPVEHLVYTDGLASVSIFIEHLDPAGEALEGLSRMGAVNAFGTMVEAYQVTAVGEVPGVTVERIGRSVTRR